MPEMKDSGIEWVGKIPKEWGLLKGKYIFSQRNQKGNEITLQLLSPTQKYGVIPQALYEEITTNKAVKLKESVNLAELKTIHKGDFCISLRSFQGGFEYSEYEGVVSPAYQVFYPTTTIVDRYYKYMFKDNGFIAKMNSYTLSLRDGKNIAFSDFGNTNIPVPPLTEQTRIADFLDTKCTEIDALTADIQTQIDTLEQYKRSVITEAVTKGLDADAEMKDSGIEWIGNIPMHWEIKKMKYVSNLSRGIFGHRPRNDPQYYDGEYPFIQTGDVATARKYICEYSQTLSELGKRVSKEFKAGTIAFTLAANVGDVAILNFDSYFPDSVMAVVPRKEINNIYLYYILSVMKNEFLRVAIVNTQLNLNVERVGNVKIPVTFDKVEQEMIVRFLDAKCEDIDEAIDGKRQQLETLAEYKKSLIYEYVTGKKEVPADGE